MQLQDFQGSVNPLKKHYSHFLSDNPILLTGHSHQAWPDVALDGQTKAFHYSATYKDQKWSYVDKVSTSVKNSFASLLQDSTGFYTLGPNTQTLLFQLLSASMGPKQNLNILTSDQEFHSARRQLHRLAEAGHTIQIVPLKPFSTFEDRFLTQLNSHTTHAFLSKVFFRDGLILDLNPIATFCHQKGIPLIVDCYHALNAIPFTIQQDSLENAYILGGGYKYCQLGEGNCFLRRPRHCNLKPLFTGWMAEMENLESSTDLTASTFFPDSHRRFDGATFDPTSFYRAQSVFQFFAEHQLDPIFLSKINTWQKSRLLTTLQNADLNPKHFHYPEYLQTRSTGGFLSFFCANPASLHQQLLKRNIHVDYRGNTVRMGPAPYLSIDQIDFAAEETIKIIRKAS